MTEAVAVFLTSAAGEELIEAARLQPGDLTTKILALRKKFSALDGEQISGAVAIVDGRERAKARGFTAAERLFVTPDALAQATSPVLSAYHAQLFTNCETVVDLCCGIGMDTLALALRGKRVIAIDQDAARLHLARANAAILGVTEQIEFLHGDCTELPWKANGAFFDPARRTETQRVSRFGENYAPPLSFFSSLTDRVRIAVAKLSPALPDDVLAELGGRLQFLSEQRACKEACVVLDGSSSESIEALLLPEQVRFASGGEVSIAGSIGQFLLDPDPAIVRANALGEVCERTDAALISGDDAYLTTDSAEVVVGARHYRVLAELPYRPKEVAAWLRSAGYGRLVVKKRRFPKEPDAIARELKLPNAGKEVTLVLVATGKSHRAVLCEPHTVE